MNDTLKAAGRIGAELGAAKAENEKLRELLSVCRPILREYGYWRLVERLEAALAQQAEPACVACEGNPAACNNPCALCGKQAESTDTYTAVDMATAAAQGFRDGQAAVEQASAQDEREAFDLFPDQLKALAERLKQYRETHKDDVCSPQEVLRQCKAWAGSDQYHGTGTGDSFQRAADLIEALLAARPAQTTPQPEQSEELAWEVLKAATDILDRRAAPHAWVSQAWAAGSKVITSRRAALSAQGGEA